MREKIATPGTSWLIFIYAGCFGKSMSQPIVVTRLWFKLLSVLYVSKAERLAML